MSILKSCVSLPVSSSELLLELVDKSKDYALMHGAGMRSKENFSRDALQFAPFLLTPSAFPRSEFAKAVKLQVILNELINAVAHDDEFLSETLANTIKADEFTKRLFDIYKNCKSDGDLTDDTVTLGVLRSDYLLHSNDLAPATSAVIKQVEINTIASSFGGISTIITKQHKFVLQELGLGRPDVYKNIPDNSAVADICNGMKLALDIYNGKTTTAILFVVEDVTINICDQRVLEFYIRENYPDVQVFRQTLTQIYDIAKLGQQGELILKNIEVGVVYFRAGYEPGHYHSEQEWSARHLIERSKAIKCPSINYHLTGTKKVQQALAVPGTLEKFFKDENAAEKIRLCQEVFTGLYPLDSDEVYEMALKEPIKFVLKPQREGGGNNVYGLDIPPFLANMSKQERSAWILMDRINPPANKGYMVRSGANSNETPPPLDEFVSELGIFGIIIGSSNKIFNNYQAGHMLRTKLSTVNEGGVAAGLGALDTPFLIDNSDEN